MGPFRIEIFGCDINFNVLVFTSLSCSLRDVFRKRSIAKISWQDDGDCRATIFWRV